MINHQEHECYLQSPTKAFANAIANPPVYFVDITQGSSFRAGQVAFFDVKVINPNSNSYLQHSTKKVMENAEKQKSRCYNERILNVEHGSFAPLIYSVTGGMGPQAKTFEKLLCNKLAYKQKQNYNDIINYYRCKLSFLIRKMILLCIRGSRKTSNRTVELSNMDDLEFNSFESKVN